MPISSKVVPVYPVYPVKFLFIKLPLIFSTSDADTLVYTRVSAFRFLIAIINNPIVTSEHNHANQSPKRT